MAQNELVQITAAIRAGEHRRAEQLGRDALARSPEDNGIKLMLALSLHLQQRVEEALPLYVGLAEQLDDSLSWNNYATALKDLGRLPEAAKAFARAVELDSANLTPKTQLGLLLIDLRDYTTARRLLLEVVEAEPDSMAARVDAARACCHCQDMEGATELLKRWHQWLPFDDDTLQFSLAQVLTLKDDLPDAVDVLEDLLLRWPMQFDVRLLLSHHYERLNRLDDIEAMLAPLFRAGSGATEIQIKEANHALAALALRRGDASGALALLEQAGPEHENSFTHYFQLGAVYDKLGKTTLAMESLQVAHRLDERERRFDSPEFFLPGGPAMPIRAPRLDAEQFARWPALAAPEMLDSPIFVVGFPRSGTTLLEQALDAHPGLQSMDENPFFNRLADILGNHNKLILQDLSVLRQFDVDELRKRYHVMVGERIVRNPGARLVDKNPLNILRLPVIRRVFPNARILLAVRHPCDVILSCYMQQFRAPDFALLCRSIESLAVGFRRTFDYWYSQSALLAPAVHELKYEDFVRDFESGMRAVTDFLELPWAESMLRPAERAQAKGYISTPSYAQVTQPVNSKSVDRWRRYEKHFAGSSLQPLEPYLARWGYAGVAENSR